MYLRAQDGSDSVAENLLRRNAMGSSQDLERLSDNLKARTAELGRQIGESTLSQGTTSDLLAKIAELRARTERTSSVVAEVSAVKPLR